MRSRAYRETYRRHRLLFLLPPVILALAIGFVSYAGSKTYASTASLWVDNNAAASNSSLAVGPTDIQSVQPSAAEQTVLNELLATGTFDTNVALGTGMVSKAGASSLAQTIRSAVTSTVPGPQVLQVNFTGSSPLIAERVVASVLTQLQRETQRFSRDFGTAALAYDRTQEQSAAKTVAQAKAAVNSYLKLHPSATAQSDQTYASLVAALSDATSALNSATTQLNQAGAQAQGTVSGVTLSVLDAPSLNPAPTTGLKSLMMKVIGGGVAGLLISFIIIVILTPGGADDWAADITAARDEGSREQIAVLIGQAPSLRGAVSVRERPGQARAIGGQRRRYGISEQSHEDR
jgi:hypothetical protein